MKRFLFSAALAMVLPLAAAAQEPFDAQKAGLSQPVIAVTMALAQNADALQLTDEQRGAVKAWMDEMPAKRIAVERETVAMRTELRQMIAAGAPVAEREALATRIGAKETEMAMMRSACVDHWRSVLTPEQFAELLRLAGVTE